MSFGRDEFNPESFVFEQILWRETPGLSDANQWAQNLGVVRLLLDNGGRPTEVIDNDYAYQVPKAYDFDGTSVEFLPHWGFYKVGELSLRTPANADIINTDLEAAKYVASRSPLAK